MVNFPREAQAAQTLLLHPDDTVLVCIRAIAKGDCITVDGASFYAPQAVAVGHKVARRALALGDRVVKYGAPIGSMTEAVDQGEHVHAHNMQSDYIRSHTRQESGGATHV